MKLRTLFFVAVFIAGLFASPAIAGDCQKAVELYNRGTFSTDLNEKEVLFKKALALSCENAEVLAKIHNNLGDAYEKQGRIEEGLREYKKAINVDPELATPYLSLGDIYSRMGVFEYAIEYYENGLVLKENQLTRTNLENARKKAPLYRSRNELLSALSLSSSQRTIRPVPSINLCFGFDQAKMTQQGERQLEALLDAIRDEELISYRFCMSGHACDIGTDEYNQKLSEERAHAACNWLVKNGISSERLEAIGYGEERPLDSRKTEEARKLNRRVEIRTIGLTIGLTRATDQAPPKAIALFNEGERLLKESNFLQACTRFEEALKIFRENHFRDGIRAATACLYLVYTELNDDEKASSYLEQFQKIAGEE